MKISFVTMQKNEKDLLEGFIKYHSSLSSMADIYILDNGSDDIDTINILDKYKQLGVNVFFEYSEREHFEKKGDTVKDFIAKLDLQSYYDFVIPMDCDEIFCLEDSSSLILNKDVIHRELELLFSLDKGRGFRIYNCFNNVPLIKDKFRKAPQKKTFFSSKSNIIRLDTGFHLFGLDEELTDSKFTYIHFHNRYYQGVMASARNKMIARVPDYTNETLLQHRERKKAGWHLVKYFLQTKEQYYKEKMLLDESSGKVFSVPFEEHINNIGLKYPFTNASADSDNEIFWLKSPSNLYAMDSAIKEQLSINKDKTIAFSFGNKINGFAFANISYDDNIGFGWEGNPIKLMRDREMGSPIFDSFALAMKVDKTFKVRVINSTYKVCIYMHDILFDNHGLNLSCGGREIFSNVNTEKGIVTKLEFIVKVENHCLDLNFSSHLTNFIVNAITIEEKLDTNLYEKIHRFPLKDLTPKKDFFSKTKLSKSKESIKATENRLLNGIKGKKITNKCDYEVVVKGVVDYYSDYLTENGVIIDPELGQEHQYATPSFSLACSSLVHIDEKYLKLALKTLKVAITNLVQRTCPNKHEDFFPYLIAKTLINLKAYISDDEFCDLIKPLEKINSYAIYRSPVGGSDKAGQNWNMLASAGESILNSFKGTGLNSFIDNSLALQARHFNYETGFYAEGPMIYDLKPRTLWSDALASGYHGMFKSEMGVFLKLGALNSLSIQSPNGYLVPGGRSGNHIWGEALQCLLFEIYSSVYSSESNYQIASLFHAGAKLSLEAIKRNINPNGDLNVSKNKFKPELRVGYESYTSRSHYNLFSAALLSVAKSYYETLDFEKINEQTQAIALSEKTHLDLSEVTGRHIATYNGNQVVIDLGKNLKQNANGIVRCLLNNGSGLIEGSIRNASFSQIEPTIYSSISVIYCYKGNEYSLAGCNFNKYHSVEVKQERNSAGLTLFVKYLLSAESFILNTININDDGFLIEFSSSSDIDIKNMTFPFLSGDGQDSFKYSQEGSFFTINDSLGMYKVAFPTQSNIEIDEREFANKNGLIKIINVFTDSTEHTISISKSK